MNRNPQGRLGQIDSGDPEVMEWRQGGGCLALFGIPFLLFGLAALFLPFAAHVDGPAWIAIPFGLVFSLVGLAMIFGRKVIILDRRQGTSRSWVSLFVAFGKREHELEEFSKVSLSKEVRRSKDSSYTVYPVRIEGAGKPLKVREDRNYSKARSLAESICKFLERPLEDRSTGSPVLREADELDLSVRQRVRKKGIELELPVAPASLKSEVDVGSGTVTLRVPPSGLLPIHYILLIGMLLFVGFVFFFFLRPAFFDTGSMPPVFVGVLLVMFILMPILVVGGFVLAASRRAYEVQVTRDMLTVETRGVIGSKTKTVETDVIEEVLFIGKDQHRSGMAGGVVIQTDAETLSFGAHLAEEEQRYLHGLVQFVIGAG